MILHTLHHCLFGSFVQNLLLNRQSFVLTTNATMWVFTLRYLYMLAKGDVDIYKLLVRSPEANTANTA